MWQCGITAGQNRLRSKLFDIDSFRQEQVIVSGISRVSAFLVLGSRFLVLVRFISPLTLQARIEALSFSAPSTEAPFHVDIPCKSTMGAKLSTLESIFRVRYALQT